MSWESKRPNETHEEWEAREMTARDQLCECVECDFQKRHPREEKQVTALTREQLLDIDPADSDYAIDAHVIALRHAWNWAVEAEGEGREPSMACSAVSRAWSAIAEALK